jgi:hypothetical protein
MITLKNITIIAVRMLGLYAYLNTGISFVSFMASLYYHDSSSDNFWLTHRLPLITLLLWLISGLILWFLAPRIGHLASRGLDQPIDIKNVSLSDIYLTAFLGLALYHFINSFGTALGSVVYLLHRSTGSKEEIVNYYEIFGAFCPLLLSVFLFIYAQPWSIKLAAKHQKPAEILNH